jgi:hypothetical protein
MFFLTVSIVPNVSSHLIKAHCLLLLLCAHFLQMAEIYERGPMACGIDSRLLHFYTGGILVLNNTDPPIHDHLVSIAGWGEENGLKYWIIRNSWVQTKLHSRFCFLYPCLSFLAFFKLVFFSCKLIHYKQLLMLLLLLFPFPPISLTHSDQCS